MLHMRSEIMFYTQVDVSLQTQISEPTYDYSIGGPDIDRVPVIDHLQVISFFILLERLKHIISLSRLQVHSIIPQMKVKTVSIVLLSCIFLALEVEGVLVEWLTCHANSTRSRR